MIVSILYRLEGSPACDTPETFADVNDGDWYADAVRWAASEKIVAGYSAEAFGPNDPITREQLARSFITTPSIKVAMSQRAPISAPSQMATASQIGHARPWNGRTPKDW